MMLKVIMVISSLTPIVGGAEKQALLLSEFLHYKNCHVSILTRSVSGTKHREIINGVKIIRTGYHKPGLFWSLISSICWFWILLKNRKEYQILHAHQPFSSAIICGIAGKILKKTTICKIPGDRAVAYVRGIRGFVLKNTIDKFIVMNPSSYINLSKIIPIKKILLISNGEDFEVNNEFIRKNDEKTILFVGRLIKIKGVDLILRAFKDVVNVIPDAKLILVGDGPERLNLIALTEELKIKDKVEFVGFIGQKEVIVYYQKSSVFVNSSFSEGISNSLLEAVRLGIPIIASEIPGNTAIIENWRTGLLFLKGNYSQMAQLIIWVLKNENKARILADNARLIISKKFDIRMIADQYIQLYKECLSTNGKE